MKRSLTGHVGRQGTITTTNNAASVSRDKSNLVRRTKYPQRYDAARAPRKFVRSEPGRNSSTRVLWSTG